MEKRTQELRNFINSLASNINKNEKTKELVNAFYSLYADDWRHQYSEVTKYILDLNKEYSFDELESILDQIVENLDYLKSYIDKDPDKNKLIIDKLIDHISLELIRLDYSSKVDDSNVKRHRELNRKTELIKDEIKTQRTQNITILGIFAAIVASFFTGLSIAVNSFSAISSVSAVKLTFLVLLIWFLFMHILNYMYRFICKINNIDSFNIHWSINLIAIALILFFGGLSFAEEELGKISELVE